MNKPSMHRIHPRNPYQPLLRRAVIVLIVTVVISVGFPLYIGFSQPIVFTPLLINLVTLYRLDRVIRDIIKERDAYEQMHQTERCEHIGRQVPDGN